jgi:hypothetical protein
MLPWLPSRLHLQVEGREVLPAGQGPGPRCQVTVCGARWEVTRESVETRARRESFGQ